MNMLGFLQSKNLMEHLIRQQEQWRMGCPKTVLAQQPFIIGFKPLQCLGIDKYPSSMDQETGMWGVPENPEIGLGTQIIQVRLMTVLVLKPMVTWDYPILRTQHVLKQFGPPSHAQLPEEFMII